MLMCEGAAKIKDIFFSIDDQLLLLLMVNGYRQAGSTFTLFKVSAQFKVLPLVSLPCFCTNAHDTESATLAIHTQELSFSQLSSLLYSQLMPQTYFGVRGLLRVLPTFSKPSNVCHIPYLNTLQSLRALSLRSRQKY